MKISRQGVSYYPLFDSGAADYSIQNDVVKLAHELNEVKDSE